MNSEKSLTYNFAKSYLLFGYRQFYNDITIIGKENIPTDSNTAIIFAPNHLNALMDALAISYIMPRQKSVVYLARADLFANRSIAKIMRLAKIYPAFRMRDGFENLEKNNSSFDQCIQTMTNGEAVCIMPEGGQGEKRRIQPLVKGIFRLAFEAQQHFGKEKIVKIVPVGIDMGDLIKSNKHLIINIGEAISIENEFENFERNQAITINSMRKKLRQSLSELTRNLDTDNYYECFDTVCELMATNFEKTGNGESEVVGKFRIKQQTAKLLCQLEKSTPEVVFEICKLSAKFEQQMDELNFKTSIFNKLKSDKSGISAFFSLLITSPIFLFGFLTNALPTFSPVWIRKAIDTEYSGFFSSIQFGLGMLLFPAFYLVQTIIFHFSISGSIGLTIIFLVLQYFTRSFSLKWYSGLKILYHKLRFNHILSSDGEQSEKLHKAIELKNKIEHLLNSSKKSSI